jgi:hypothetical protein
MENAKLEMDANNLALFLFWAILDAFSLRISKKW